MFLWVLTPRITNIIDKRVAVTNHADEDCCVDIDKSGIILQHSVFRNNWLKVCHKLAMSWRQSVSRSQFSALHHIRFKLTSAAASMIQLQNNFDRDRTRTCNPQIRSLVPYPLGHTTHVNINQKCSEQSERKFQSRLQYMVLNVCVSFIIARCWYKYIFTDVNKQTNWTKMHLIYVVNLDLLSQSKSKSE